MAKVPGSDTTKEQTGDTVTSPKNVKTKVSITVTDFDPQGKVNFMETQYGTFFGEFVQYLKTKEAELGSFSLRIDLSALVLGGCGGEVNEGYGGGINLDNCNC